MTGSMGFISDGGFGRVTQATLSNQDSEKGTQGRSTVPEHLTSGGFFLAHRLKAIGSVSRGSDECGVFGRRNRRIRHQCQHTTEAAA